MSSVTKKEKEAKELKDLLLYTQQQVPNLSSQCFLLEKAGDIQNSVKNGNIIINRKKNSPVRQLGTDLTGNKAKSNLSYVQEITSLQASNYEKYFRFTPDKIAQMIHYMSVEEVLVDKKGKVKRTIPIMNTEKNLKDYDFPTELLKPSKVTRTGAGIESLNINFVGIDSFTRKQVSMTAKFMFQDIKTMLVDPYAKLFVLEKSRGEDENKLFRSLDFKIGWNSNNEEIRKNISKLNLTIRTHLVKYSFDVRQDGSIVVDATYRGYYVEAFSGPQANILEIAKTRYLEIKQRQEEIKKRATTYRRNNKKHVTLQERQMFVLQTLQRQATSSSRRGSAPLTDVSGYTTFMDSIKNETYTELTRVITSTASLQKKLLSAAELKLAEPERAKRIRPKLQSEVGGTINTILGSFNGQFDAKYRNQDINKLINDIGALITDFMSRSQKETQKAQSGIQNARQNAFDEQIRLASLARLKALQVIAEQLTKSKDIKYVKIPRDIVRNFKLASAAGSQADIAATFDKLGNNASAYIRNDLSVSTADFDNESYQIIPFVFLGTLLENMLEIPAQYTEKNNKYVPDKSTTVYDLMKRAGSNVKIDLGYISYNGPYSGRRVRNLDLFNLPISLIELNNFFNRIVLSKGRVFYSFNEFIDDLLKKFLTGIFSTCSKESNSKGLGAPKVETTIGDLPEGKSRTTQYFIHGAKETINSLVKAGINPRTFGLYRANLRASIPHFFVFGKDTGIEKSVKLTDIADDQLKTNVYYSPRASLVNDIDGNDILKKTGFIPAVFQADVETIGFPLMNLGQLIYVDLKPTITEKEAKSRPFDASGYYGVHKVSHTVTRDKFSTNITSILQISDKDRDKVRIGGLGNLTGTQEGVKRTGQYINVKSAGTYASAWSKAGKVAGSASSPAPATVPPATPSPSEIQITDFDGIPARYQADKSRFVKAIEVGVMKGFGSSEFIKLVKADNISDDPLGLALFQTEQPTAVAVVQLGQSPDDVLTAKGALEIYGKKINGVMSPPSTTSDFGDIAGEVWKKSKFTTAAVKKQAAIIRATAADKSLMAELNEASRKGLCLMIFEEFASGDASVRWITVWQ